MIKLIGRAFRLKCPACGRGSLYRGFLAMNQSCPECGSSFKREDGFYLGAIYLNYGLTAVLVTILFPALVLSYTLTSKQALWVCFAVVIIFPLSLFRHARSLWLAFDHYLDPQSDGETAGSAKDTSAKP